MIEKTRQTVAQKFRETATNEQWFELVNDQENLTPDEFKSKYGFTWSAVLKDAVAKGLYVKKKYSTERLCIQQEGASDKASFIVTDVSKDVHKKQRSIELYDDIAIRLNRLRDDKRQYTFASILNQLLDEALKKYGY